MNLINCSVTKILGPIYYEYGVYWVPCEFAPGPVRISKTTIMFSTKEEAEKVEVGYEFLT